MTEDVYWTIAICALGFVTASGWVKAGYYKGLFVRCLIDLICLEEGVDRQTAIKIYYEEKRKRRERIKVQDGR